MENKKVIEILEKVRIGKPEIKIISTSLEMLENANYLVVVWEDHQYGDDEQYNDIIDLGKMEIVDLDNIDDIDEWEKLNELRISL